MCLFESYKGTKNEIYYFKGILQPCNLKESQVFLLLNSKWLTS